MTAAVAQPLAITADLQQTFLSGDKKEESWLCSKPSDNYQSLFDSIVNSEILTGEFARILGSSDSADVQIHVGFDGKISIKGSSDTEWHEIKTDTVLENSAKKVAKFSQAKYQELKTSTKPVDGYECLNVPSTSLKASHTATSKKGNPTSTASKTPGKGTVNHDNTSLKAHSVGLRGLNNDSGSDCWANALFQMISNSDALSAHLSDKFPDYNMASGAGIRAAIASIDPHFAMGQQDPTEALGLLLSHATPDPKGTKPPIETSMRKTITVTDKTKTTTVQGKTKPVTHVLPGPSVPVGSIQVPISRDLSFDKSLKRYFDASFTDKTGAPYRDAGIVGTVIKESTRFATAPERLTISLNRFEAKQTPSGDFRATKISDDIEDIPMDVKIGAEDGSEQKLNLQSFIVHSGSNSINSGHYVTYVKRGGNWFLCNDSRVRQVTPFEVQAALKQAYVLNYDKDDTKSKPALPASTTSTSPTKPSATAKQVAEYKAQVRALSELKYTLSIDQATYKAMTPQQQAAYKLELDKAFKFLVPDPKARTKILNDIADRANKKTGWASTAFGRQNAKSIHAKRPYLIAKFLNTDSTIQGLLASYEKGLDDDKALISSTSAPNTHTYTDLTQVKDLAQQITDLNQDNQLAQSTGLTFNYTPSFETIDEYTAEMKQQLDFLNKHRSLIDFKSDVKAKAAKKKLQELVEKHCGTGRRLNSNNFETIIRKEISHALFAEDALDNSSDLKEMFSCFETLNTIALANLNSTTTSEIANINKSYVAEKTRIEQSFVDSMTKGLKAIDGKTPITQSMIDDAFHTIDKPVQTLFDINKANGTKIRKSLRNDLHPALANVLEPLGMTFKRVSSKVEVDFTASTNPTQRLKDLEKLTKGWVYNGSPELDQLETIFKSGHSLRLLPELSGIAKALKHLSDTDPFRASVLKKYPTIALYVSKVK